MNLSSLLPLAGLVALSAGMAETEGPFLLNTSSAEKTVHGPFLRSTFTPVSGPAVTTAPGEFFILQALGPMTTTALTNQPLVEDFSSGAGSWFAEGTLLLSDEVRLMPGAANKQWVPQALNAGVELFREANSPARMIRFANGHLYFDQIDEFTLTSPASTRIREIRRNAYGLAKPPGGETLHPPHDWVWLENSSGSGGFAIIAGSGSTLRATAGGIRVAGSGSGWILPAESLNAAHLAVAATHPSLILLPAEERGQWVGTYTWSGQSQILRIFDRNENGRPDTTGDLWQVTRSGASDAAGVVLAFDDTDAPRVAYFTPPAGTPVAELLLDESGGALGDRFARALDSIGATDTQAERQADGPVLKPQVIVEDWNRDNAFFEGGLLTGGFLGADRAGRRVGDWSSAWDLDGDRIGDVFEYNPDMIFNFKNTFVSVLEIHVDPAQPRADFVQRRGYDMQFHGSHFSKSPLASQFVGEARAGFEEHFFVDVPADGSDPDFPNGASFFYYTLGGGDVKRLTMGRLSGHGALRAWEIELDPVPADPDEVNFNLVRWQDAKGRDLVLNSISIPETWDGSTLGPRAYLTGWYAMAEQKYKTGALYAAFMPPGSQMGSAEGMYGGAYTTQERIEKDESGGSYALYHSPLMGDLHLKGADFGSYAVPSGTPDFWLDINRFYHREAHLGPERFVGVEPAIRFRSREAKRMEGPVFLSYRDRSGDGFIDQYLYDIDNDGIYERVLDYCPESAVLKIRDDRFLTAWPERIEYQVIDYLPENYDAISELYQKGFHMPPLVASVQIGSGGIPVQLQTHPFFRERTPSVFLSLGQEWFIRTAVNVDHNSHGNHAWTDFRPSGLSRLGTLLVEQGLQQTEPRGAWHSGALDGLDLLVLTHLERTPSSDEVEALVRWIERGGKLLLAPLADSAQRHRFNALGARLGFGLGDTLLDRLAVKAQWVSLGPINRPDSRAALRKMPGPWNQIERFNAPQNRAWLADFSALSFIGYPLENLSDGWQIDLRYRDTDDAKRDLVASKRMGSGRIVLSGVDWLTNRSIWHHESFEHGTQNERLVARLIEQVAADLPQPRVEAIAYHESSLEFTVSGKGGWVRFPRRYQARATGLAHIGNEIDLPPPRQLSHGELNGNRVEVGESGLLHSIRIPAGRHSIIIHYPESQ